MDRDLKRAIADYKRRYFAKKYNEGAFYASDFKQIIEMGSCDPWTLIHNSLMAGFMIGYRKGRRDQRERGR